MTLLKTAKGKDALLRRDPAINPRERQIMVLANGSRTRRSISMLMERTIDTEINRLLQAGFLDEKPTSETKTDSGQTTNSA